MSDLYPKGNGALFANADKQKENHPDFRGNIEVTGEQIRKLIEMSKAGLEVKLQVAGWWRQPKAGGNTFLSMVTEAYMKDQAPQQYPPMQQQGGHQPAQVGQIPQGAPQQQMAPQQMAPQQYQQPAPVAPQAVPPASDFAFDDKDVPF